MKKISHDEFVAALNQQLKADKAAVNSRIVDFVESLKASLKEKGSTTTIDGLGTFGLDKGILTFEADEILALEINYKYAGMEAIEIMPAYDKKHQDDQEGKKKENTPEKKPADQPVKPAPGKAPEPEKGEADPVERDPFNLEISEPAGKPDKKPALLQKGSDPDPEPGAGMDELDLDAETGFEVEKPRSKAAIYVLAAMAAVLVLALFAYQPDMDLPFELPGLAGAGGVAAGEPPVNIPTEPTEHELRQGELPAENQENRDETDPAEESATTSDSVDIPAVPVSGIEPEAPDSPYGLYGSLSDLNREFTIVVHSLPYRLASEERDMLNHAGYRAVLNKVTLADGRETWRVGIGQFETMDEATEAIERLDEPYKSSNFVARVR